MPSRGFMGALCLGAEIVHRGWIPVLQRDIFRGNFDVRDSRLAWEGDIPFKLQAALATSHPSDLSHE